MVQTYWEFLSIMLLYCHSIDLQVSAEIISSPSSRVDAEGVYRDWGLLDSPLPFWAGRDILMGKSRNKIRNYQVTFIRLHKTNPPGKFASTLLKRG